MAQSPPIVFVVDDDISVREALELLLRHEGLGVEMFVSAQEFLTRPRATVPSCLVLDISLPGLNGLELQKRVAVERSNALLDREAEIRDFKARYACLTAREREVMALVVIGLPNKQVGGELGISEITVKAHRGSMMRKMKADSLAELVSIATRLRLVRPFGTSLPLAR